MNRSTCKSTVLLCVSLLLLVVLSCGTMEPVEPGGPIEKSPVVPPTIIINQRESNTFTPIAPPAITFTPVAPPTVPPTPPVSRGFFIVSLISGKCIDARGLPGTENETPLQLWDCEFNDPNTDQKWEFVNDGFLQNTLSDKCMDVRGLPPGVGNEDIIQLWNCEFSDLGNTDQKWQITNDGFLVNSRSGKCMDVRGLPGITNEDPLQLWDCEYGSSNTDQQWYLR